MAAGGGFLRRLYAETARLVQQEPTIQHWRVVVLCPSRQLHFGDPAPVAEFVEQRVQWIELLSAAANPTSPVLVQALALLLQSEQDLPASTAALRARLAGSSQTVEIDDVIAAWPTGKSLGAGRRRVRPWEKPRSPCASWAAAVAP